MRTVRLAVLAGLLAAGACSESKDAGTTGTAGTTGSGGSAGGAVDAAADHAVTPFEEQALAIAREYTTWGRVDDELRWAPALCRQPLPGVARQSASDDPSTHGQKLYSVFAKIWSAYPNGPHDGQVVVKQSWTIEPVTGSDASFDPGMAPIPGENGDHFYPYAKGPDGGLFRADKAAGLFIMFKVDPATPDTDAGWVYATVAPSGSVTSAGRVATCMGCHETSATHERLFGVPKSPAF